MIQVGVLALVMARSFPKHRKHLPVVSQECTQAQLTGFSATLLGGIFAWAPVIPQAPSALHQGLAAEVVEGSVLIIVLVVLPASRRAYI